MFGLLKADTLALVCADLEEAIENSWAKAREVDYYRDALLALRDLVGEGGANEMVKKARER